MQKQQTYEDLMDRFLQMPGQFREAYHRKEWFRAKYIYDSAIVIGLFLEVPENIREQVFGSRQHEEIIDGMFPEWMLEQVMRECVIKNRLGFECVVYRIPGEVGFYGAKKGARDQLPACRGKPGIPCRVTAERGNRDENGGYLHRHHPARACKGRRQGNLYHAVPDAGWPGI